MTKSVLQELDFALVGRIAVAATELELAILNLAKRVSTDAVENDIYVFSSRQRLFKVCKIGLEELANTQFNPGMFLQCGSHFARVGAALDDRDAVVHGVLHGVHGVPFFFQARKHRDVAADPESLIAILRELEEVAGHTEAISLTIDRNVDPEIMQRLVAK